MCGIAGIHNIDNKNHIEMEACIKKVTSSLIHRGPDDHGYYVDDKIALGHRMLNIIDLETGHQPIFNEDGSMCIILVVRYIIIKA